MVLRYQLQHWREKALVFLKFLLFRRLEHILARQLLHLVHALYKGQVLHLKSVRAQDIPTLQPLSLSG